MWAGTSARTHGDKKEASPARNASGTVTLPGDIGSGLAHDDGRPGVGKQGLHIAGPVGHRRIRPAEEPLGVRREHVDAAAGARRTEIVVPVGRMDGGAGSAEEDGPPYSGQVVARDEVSTGHVAGDHLAPGPVLADGRVPDALAILGEGVPGGDAAG